MPLLESCPTAIEDYRALIDEIARYRNCVSSRWVRERRRWPDLPENKPIEAFLESVSDEHREVLAQMLQDACDEGAHTVLAVLTDEINLSGYRLTRNGRELPVEPYGTQLYWDWLARADGDEWPPDAELTEAAHS